MKNIFLLSFINLMILNVFAQCDWQALGPDDFNQPAYEKTITHDMAIDSSGFIYLVNEGNTDNGNKASVMRYDGNSWGYVGIPGFSVGRVKNMSIAISPSGIPYVLYGDYFYDGVTIMKYNGTSWVNVGTPGLLAATSHFTDIEIDGSGAPYIVYVNVDDKAIVKKFDGSSWVNVGNPSFSDGSVSGLKLALDANNTPYVVYADDSNGLKATVMKFDGNSWVNVGPPGFSDGHVTYTDISIDSNGYPYVSFLDLDIYKATVMKFDGNSWGYVGSRGVSVGQARNIEMYVSNNIPYLVFKDLTDYDRATVMKFDGNSWVYVGTQGFSKIVANYTNITFDNSGTPYVSYVVDGDFKTIVNKFNGNDWVNIGANGFSDGFSGSPDMAVDGNGILYVAYQDDSTKATVKKYDNGMWVTLGAPSFSATGPRFINIKIDVNGVPYVVYMDVGNSSKATVMKYNGNVWINVGLPGFSAGIVLFTDIAIDDNGTPYVVFQDLAHNEKATVMKYDGSTWVNVGSPGFSAGKADFTNILIDGNGDPYVMYQDEGNNDKATVMMFNGNAWIPVGAVGFSSGKANYASLALDANNTPFVFYSDGDNNDKATVMKYDGNSWVSVGTQGFSAGIARYNNITLDNDNKPYVIYQDYNSQQPSVMKFDGSAWVTLGTAGFTAGRAYETGLAIDNNDNVYVAYQSGIIGYVFAKKFIVEDFEWSGAVNTDWEEEANWVGGNIACNSADVLIPSGTPNYPVLEVNVTVNNIELEAGAILTVPSDYTLNVEGDLINNGVITVKSGGALVQDVNSTLAGNGTYNVERDILGPQTFVGSPINGQSVGGFGIVPSGLNGAQIIPNGTNPCNPDSLDSSSPNGNILEIREDANPISNCSQSLLFVKSSGNLENGRGYLVNSSDTTLAFSGTVNNGIVTYGSLTRQSGSIGTIDGSNVSRGWHLVSNPYPSPIELTGTELNAMGFDNQIHRYNSTTGNWESNDPLINTNIAVGQGFLIRKTTVGGTVGFELDNSFRIGGNPTYYKQAASRDKYLDITLNNGGQSVKSMIYFQGNATADFDPLYDVNKLMGEYRNPMLYTLVGNERLSYNAVPTLLPEEQKTVSLAVHAGTNGNFSLSFDGVNSLENNDITVVLEDLILDTTLNLGTIQTYGFESKNSDVNARFLLHFTKAEANNVLEVGKEGISLYPNPTTDDLILKFDNKHNYNSAIVYDITGKEKGRIIMSREDNKYQIETTQLDKGIYFIRMSGENTLSTLKFVKY